jgi:hypothetical protein
MRAKWLVLALAFVLEAISLYGWCSYFMVGPQHDAGFEVAMLTGQLGLIAFIGAMWLDTRWFARGKR